MTCRTPDEKDPGDGLSRWKCRICTSDGTTMSTKEVMRKIDSQKLDSDIMKYVAHLLTRVRRLEAEILATKDASNAGTIEPTHTTPPHVSEQRTRPKPDKSVLIIGDKSVKKLRSRLLSLLPKKSPIVIRWTTKKDSKAMFELADKFLEDNPQPTHIIVHGGQEECIEFRKESYIAEVVAFYERSMAKRSDCSWSIATVPQIHKDCKDTNEILNGQQARMKYDMIDLTLAHRPMLSRGSCSYVGLDETADACAKSIARKAAAFLGVKIVAPKPPETVKTTEITPAPSGINRRPSVQPEGVRNATGGWQRDRPLTQRPRPSFNNENRRPHQRNDMGRRPRNQPRERRPETSRDRRNSPRPPSSEGLAKLAREFIRAYEMEKRDKKPRAKRS